MARTVRLGSKQWLVSTRPGDGDGAPLDLRDRDAARDTLRRLMRDPDNARVLRAALLDLAPGTDSRRQKDPVVVEQLSGYASTGRLRLLTPGAADNRDPLEGVELSDSNAPAPLPVAPPPRQRRKTWVKFKVVDEESGEPVPSVRLRITTPDGIENFYTTTSAGLIEITDIEPGDCDVACDTKDLKPESVLDFVGMGEPTGAPSGTANGNGSGRPGGVSKVTQVEFYKVKSGDSLAGLAKEAGITWQELAKLNWGTDDPAKINTHLRDDVGCTKTTSSGKNYIFDDTDEPGLIRLPRAWSREGLVTAETHVIRVQPLPKPTLWQFSV